MEEKEKSRQDVTLESRVKRQKNLLAMAGYGMFLTGFLSAAFVIFTCTDFSVYGERALVICTVTAGFMFGLVRLLGILAERVLFLEDRKAEIDKISRKKDGILLFSMVVIMYASLFIMYRLFIV